MQANQSLAPGKYLGRTHLAHEYIGSHLYKLKIHFRDPGEMEKRYRSLSDAGMRCGRAVGSLIEMLLGEIGEPKLVPLMDLNMMVMLTGRERTLAEYRALLEDAGLRFSKSTPIRSPMSVIEAVAAAR